MAIGGLGQWFRTNEKKLLIRARFISICLSKESITDEKEISATGRWQITSRYFVEKYWYQSETSIIKEYSVERLDLHSIGKELFFL